jgi:hypothetical protein
MTKKQRSLRRALIVRRVGLVRGHPPDVVEASESPEAPDLEVPDDVFEQRARDGAAWTARHCGLVGDMG